MRLLPIFSLLLAGSVLPAHATDCAREDIDHYLDRGFTPQQVLELCRPGETAQQPAERPSARAAVAQAFLRDAVNGDRFEVTADSLNFRREHCVKYDRPNFAEQRKTACGHASYRIARQGLEVTGLRRKRLFWGRNAVELRSSRIEREFELGQDELSARNQAQLAKALETGERTEIPVREGVVLEKVAELLESLAVE